jgi:hypothetical protein
MTNLECVVAVLAKHRDNRRWADEDVAIDLLAQLGLDASDTATHATPLIDPAVAAAEAEADAAEAAAKAAASNAQAMRARADAIRQAPHPAPAEHQEAPAEAAAHEATAGAFVESEAAQGDISGHAAEPTVPDDEFREHRA